MWELIMDKLKRSQNQIIKDHLLTGQSITSWQAIEVYRITTLPTRVSQLRQKGLNIEDKRINKDGKHWSVYWLNSDYIEAYKVKGGNDE